MRLKSTGIQTRNNIARVPRLARSSAQERPLVIGSPRVRGAKHRKGRIFPNIQGDGRRGERTATGNSLIRTRGGGKAEKGAGGRARLCYDRAGEELYEAEDYFGYSVVAL